jgi:hypothetical protein
MWLQAQMLWIWEGVYDVLLYLLELIAQFSAVFHFVVLWHLLLRDDQ